MMNLRVPLVGRGTDDAPYRTALPGGHVLEVDYDRLVAVVAVPAHVLPAEIEKLKPGTRTTEASGVTVITLSQEQLDVIEALWDARYPTAGRRFSPEQAPTSWRVDVPKVPRPSR